MVFFLLKIANLQCGCIYRPQNKNTLIFCESEHFVLVSDGFYLITVCSAGQRIKYDHNTNEIVENCAPCDIGRYRPADQVSQWCTWCPRGYTNGVTGATDESSCTSKYLNSWCKNLDIIALK